jgi:hypothetical protein
MTAVTTAHSPSGRTFTVRLIAPGQKYGPAGTVVNDTGRKMVEFFDADDRCWDRYPEDARPVTWPYGNFTGGRYFLNDLMDRPPVDLSLNGGAPEWTVTADSLAEALAYLSLAS